MKDFFKPPKTKTLLWILSGLLVVLITFGLGIAVGYRRAIFSSEFGAQYYHGMYGDPFGRPIMSDITSGPPTMHGVAGVVIDVGSSTIFVQDPSGNEASVFIASGTPIREMNEEILPGDIVVGDGVTVIGDPDTNGQVEARFIRVFETTSTNF
jgi:hypothetical protein